MAATRNPSDAKVQHRALYDVLIPAKPWEKMMTGNLSDKKNTSTSNTLSTIYRHDCQHQSQCRWEEVASPIDTSLPQNLKILIN